MIRGALALLLLTAACGDDDAEGREERVEEVAPPDLPAPPHEVTRERSPERRDDGPRLTRFEGEVTVNGEPASPGASLPAGARVATGEDGSAILDWRGGGRFRVEGGSTALIGRAADIELLLASGRVSGHLPPGGSSGRPPLRLGTPAASAEIGGSGDLWVEASPDGRAFVAVLSGSADLGRGELDEEGRPVERRVGAGRALLVDDALPEQAVPGPAREEDAPGAARQALGEAAELDAEALEARLSAATGQLREVLDRLEAEAEQGDRLAVRHRRTEGMSRESIREVQRELVAHSQRVLRLRRTALTRWERARALELLLRTRGVDPGAGPSSLEGRALAALGVDTVP